MERCGVLLVGLAWVIGCSSSGDAVNVSIEDPVLAPQHDDGGELDDHDGVAPERGYMSADAHGTSNDGMWPGPEDIQLLSVSDWHGQLDPVSVSGVGNVGGAAVLSSYFAKERAAVPRTLTFTAGDAVGASPPLSSLFEERPAIEAMNLMGFTADTLGNHNFDGGLSLLQKHVGWAKFTYVSSNLANLASNVSGVASPYKIVQVAHTKVGVIGITNEDAASLLFPGRMGSMTVESAIARANDAIQKASAAGAKINVVLVHMGATGVDASGAPVGPLLDFARGVQKADVILGDHTDFKVATRINGALVVENRSKGLTYAKVKLKVAGSAVLWSGVEFVTPRASAVAPDPAIEAMLAPYRSALSARFDAPVGVASNVFPRAGNNERLGEAAIGNLVADAMRSRYGTQIAFTNGGGLRAPLPSSYRPADTSLRRTTSGYASGPPYDLVLGDVFAVLPFGNIVVTRTLTGAQLCAALEKSVEALPGANGRFLQVSGFSFTYTLSQPAGSRLRSVTLADGTAVACSASESFTAALPDFVNAGGDGYVMLADGAGTTRELMADVLREHVVALGTISPTVSGRIVAVP